MKVLTLWQPWPYAIFRLGKDIENRKWKPPPSIIGERIAIRAGKKWDDAAALFIFDIERIRFNENQELEAEMQAAPEMHIIGTVRVTGYFWIDEMFKESDSKWAYGPCCWKVEDPIEFDKPIARRGAQGLWEVPELEDVIKALRPKQKDS